MSEPLLFIPITKVDQEKRLVYGIATAEQEDRAGEVCDYASTKPFYEQWSNTIAQATDGRSLGNIRAMHGSVAAGKVTAISFNDQAKQIEICARIIDDYEWNKVLEGVYTGFSQGGAYAKRWTDNDGVKRYTADPHEISLVDLPCLPSATFQMVKSNGTIVDRAFKHKFGLTKSTELPVKAVTEADNSSSSVTAEYLRKGLDTCGRLAFLIEELDALQQEASLEVQDESDQSSVSSNLAQNVASLCVILRDMVTEETNELINTIGTKTPEVEQSLMEAAKAMQANARIAFAKRCPSSVKSILEKAISSGSKSDQEYIQEIHDLAVKLGAKASSQSARLQHSVGKDIGHTFAAVSELAEAHQHMIEEKMLPALQNMAERLKSIETLPRPLPFFDRTHAVSKANDIGRHDPVNLEEAFEQMGEAEREALVFKHLLNQPKKMGFAPR